MSDFTATDNFTDVVLTPNTDAARDWVKAHGFKARRPDGSVAAFPGYVIHVFLPHIRAAGLTVDGDIDDQGNVKIRVRK